MALGPFCLLHKDFIELKKVLLSEVRLISWFFNTTTILLIESHIHGSRRGAVALFMSQLLLVGIGF